MGYLSYDNFLVECCDDDNLSIFIYVRLSVELSLIMVIIVRVFPTAEIREQP